MKKKFKWDRGLEFAQTLELLKSKLIYFRELTTKGGSEKRKAKGITKFSIYITQLRNLSRISEAHEALMEWKQKGEREVYVRTRKRKDGEARLVIIPNEICKDDAYYLQNVDLKALEVYSSRFLKFNTHALRYSGITRMAEQNRPAQVIAKITHHKKLDFILDYTSERFAERVLREDIAKDSAPPLQ